MFGRGVAMVDVKSGIVSVLSQCPHGRTTHREEIDHSSRSRTRKASATCHDACQNTRPALAPSPAGQRARCSEPAHFLRCLVLLLPQQAAVCFGARHWQGLLNPQDQVALRLSGHSRKVSLRFRGLLMLPALRGCIALLLWLL